MASQKSWLDLLYLPVIGTQLFGMLALDLVPFYPRSLWEQPSSPLHFLVSLRDLYVQHTNDPFFAATAPHDPWLQAFIYVEGLVQLPLGAYLVYRMSSYGRTTGATELAALVFGCVTALGALASCFELWHMGPERVSQQEKNMLVFGSYMHFATIPAVMVVDMYLRLLRRVQS